jgi:acyl-CoA synthetase (AMP-forming)/AMP-acid ligase II
MKNSLVVMAVSMFALVSSAKVTNLKSDETAVYNVGMVELISVQLKNPEDCPDNAMCAPYAFAKVKVTLNGCLDRLLLLSSNVTKGADHKFVLNVAAVAAVNKKNVVVRCIAAPFEIKEIFLGSAYITKDSVELNVLK